MSAIANNTGHLFRLSPSKLAKILTPGLTTKKYKASPDESEPSEHAKKNVLAHGSLLEEAALEALKRVLGNLNHLEIRTHLHASTITLLEMNCVARSCPRNMSSNMPTCCKKKKGLCWTTTQAALRHDIKIYWNATNWRYWSA